MRLGDTVLRMESQHATLGDPAVFDPAFQAPHVSPPRGQTLLPDLQMVEALNRIADELTLIRIALSQPPWYRRLGAWIRRLFSQE